MESESEASAGVLPPADHIDMREHESFDPEVRNGLHLKHDLHDHDGGFVPIEHSDHPHRHHGEPRSVEIELRAAHARIEELHGDLADAEKKLADSQKGLSAASKQADDFEKEMKSQEETAKEALSECARLKSALEVAEVSAREAEQTVKNLESELQKTKAHLLEDNEAQTVLEETKKERKKLEEENIQMREKVVQLEGHVADEKSRATDLEERLQQAEVELKKQEGSLSAAEEATKTIKEQLSALEETLKRTQDELKAKEDALQAELDSSKSKVSDLLTTPEENLKVLEEEHQKQIKISEERYEALQKSLLELQGKHAELRDSLDVTGTDAEIARKKVAELELELENLLQNKGKLEEGAAELQLKLKSTEEMLNKQVDALKIAEENAEKANEEVVHLQSVLKSTEEKVRVSEEVADGLQLQVTDLTAKEAESTNHLKEVENSLQKMQLELQSKLESLEGNFKSLVSQLEEKAAQLQESLAAAALEGEEARKKVSDLELELDGLRHIQGDLEDKLRTSEEKCSQHENSVENFRTRGVELEGLITEHKTKADDAYGKVASLEAALLGTQHKADDLEMKLKLAEDNSLLFENTTMERIAELERCTKEYETRIGELEVACESAKSNEQHTKEMLLSTEKTLEETRTEMKSAIQKVSELELSVEATESDLKGSLDREKLGTEERALMADKIAELEAFIAQLEGERGELELRVQQHMSLAEKGTADLHEASVQEAKLREEICSLQEAKTELKDLLSQLENEKQMTIAQLDSTQNSFVELNEQLAQERQQLQQQIATILQENRDLTQKFSSAQETLQATVAAAELSAKQVQEGSFKESALSSQIEDLNLQLRKALDACAHVEKLEQENGNISQKFASLQEKLDATLGTAEVSARQLQEAISRESTLNAQIEDLKVQLGKAMDACAQVEELEKKLQNSVTAEEHQRQLDQILAASKLAESKLADVEEELSKSKTEINKAQKSFNEQESHLKELELKPLKSVEVFDQQLPELAKTREIELESLSPGKLRNRKKKGVTWEADGDATAKTKAVDKPTVQPPAHTLKHFAAYIFVAVVSLSLGFWLATEIDL